jgi:hypothetical protein
MSSPRPLTQSAPELETLPSISAKNRLPRPDAPASLRPRPELRRPRPKIYQKNFRYPCQCPTPLARIMRKPTPFCA